jgi:hypothetical protein
MNILRTLRQAKEETSIGQPERAEVLLGQVKESLKWALDGCAAALENLENGDPVEAESDLDLIIRKLES